MSDDLREVVLRALNRSSRFLSDPELAAVALSGGDFALERLGMDSLARFEAMMEIEERLNIEIDDDEVAGLQTFEDLLALVRGRR